MQFKVITTLSLLLVLVVSVTYSQEVNDESLDLEDVSTIDPNGEDETTTEEDFVTPTYRPRPPFSSKHPNHKPHERPSPNKSGESNSNESKGHSKESHSIEDQSKENHSVEEHSNKSNSNEDHSKVGPKDQSNESNSKENQSNKSHSQESNSNEGSSNESLPNRSNPKESNNEPAAERLPARENNGSGRIVLVQERTNEHAKPILG